MARREPAPKTQDSAPTDFSISAPAVPTYSFPSYSYSMPDWLSSITDPSYSIPPDYFSATSSCDSFDTLIGTCLTPDIPMPTYSFPIPDSGGDGGKKNADSVVPNISEVGHAMKTSLKKIIGVVVGSVLGLFGLVS
ncbi:uncharacterized protein PHACADRAFT_252472 [Phanerochaete carnosa HHB-10118-sp]|uniref:Uncharacterized protein n=1 Tax=Phanerochaete carnosa (strain HHB-10118-sp) TaxID=650164 RepID=K5WGP1_PHACS|nr:uncharacterized protein PHACADRAFT_252472 [Phanerochaete carnosa HHB-10118-sp]EKM58269.1 hypothetical protein PHACADRAFT_252472 [Phanerochaete carnosa HHB-10118-sp]